MKKVSNSCFYSEYIKAIHIEEIDPRTINENNFELKKDKIFHENTVLFVPVRTDYAYRHHSVFGKCKDIRIEWHFGEGKLE